MTAVAVAGAGLAGLVVAWRCAQRGLAVTAVDPAPGAGASWAAAGMLAPVTEAAYGEEALLALARASLRRWPSFAAELAEASGLPVPLRTAGTLLVGCDEDDLRTIEHLHGYLRELDLPAQRLGPSGCRRREDALSTRVRGGLLVEGDHSVEPRAVHAALLAAAQRAGVVLRREPVQRLLVEDGRAVGLGTGSGPVTADAVVLALGAYSTSLPGVPALPVRPVKGQILRLAGEPLLAGTVRAVVRGRSVYLVPHDDGRLVVGATVEERGFDDRVTAGGVLDLLTDAEQVVPGVRELALVETLARFRPGTPDNAPLLGAAALPGLVLATGHYRNGVLLAPVTGEAVAALLADGALPELARPFVPERFQEVA